MSGWLILIVAAAFMLGAMCAEREDDEARDAEYDGMDVEEPLP
jgi:hypothetical protein